MNVIHQESTAILAWPSATRIKQCTRMSVASTDAVTFFKVVIVPSVASPVAMVGNCLNVTVREWRWMLACLSLITSMVDHMKQVGDHTGREKSFAT